MQTPNNALYASQLRNLQQSQDQRRSSKYTRAVYLVFHTQALIEMISERMEVKMHDGWCGPDSFDGEFRQDCLHLALTCRSLFEPATNLLWKRLDSFDSLFCCFPDGIWLKISDERGRRHKVHSKWVSRIRHTTDQAFIDLFA